MVITYLVPQLALLVSFCDWDHRSMTTLCIHHIHQNHDAFLVARVGKFSKWIKATSPYPELRQAFSGHTHSQWIIAAESYAGHCIPAWTGAVLDHKKLAASVARIYLSGVAIGNGIANETVQAGSLPEHVHVGLSRRLHQLAVHAFNIAPFHGLHWNQISATHHSRDTIDAKHYGRCVTVAVAIGVGRNPSFVRVVPSGQIRCTKPYSSTGCHSSISCMIAL
jgi:hypothetical protein